MKIPIRTHFHDVDGPGTFEADTVAHCGQSLAGKFVWTLTLTDIWSGWTENRAVWNKNARQIVTRLSDVEQRLAFDITAFDTDNGSEFLNYPLLRYFHNRAEQVHFTRSRPYHKNDQAHVEQKQWTHVRQLLGYDRFEERRLVALIDDATASPPRPIRAFWQAPRSPNKPKNNCAPSLRPSTRLNCTSRSRPNCAPSSAWFDRAEKQLPAHLGKEGPKRVKKQLPNPLSQPNLR